MYDPVGHEHVVARRPAMREIDRHDVDFGVQPAPVASVYEALSRDCFTTGDATAALPSGSGRAPPHEEGAQHNQQLGRARCAAARGGGRAARATATRDETRHGIGVGI